MADQPQRPYRGQGAPGRPDQRMSASGSDPLAELARLIGSQTDPFAAQPRQETREQAEWRANAKAPYNANAPEQYPPHDEAAYYDQHPDYRAGAQQFAGVPFAAGQGFTGDPYYRDDAQGDDLYEDEAPARRRGVTLTVVAVVGLVLIGTAVTFGYRSIFGSGPSGPPPVIKADTTPSKIVPATTANEQSKLIYDRVGDRNQPERLVPREEKPVDVADNLKPAPRVISTSIASATMPVVAGSIPAPAPAAAAIASPPQQAAQLPANASALAPTGPAVAAPVPAPKRVRTVTIKPDGPDAEAPVTAASPPASVPVHAPRAAPPVPAANAPLSLTPGANAAPAHNQTMRTASAPAATASVPAAAGGGYAVQVSSQRSEADAQSAFRSLQRKYPDVLGGYQPMIRRADLGDRGVYYRVQVGPFASEQATDLCSRLQTAGGQCVVQRN